jgi:hypothetical protein
MGYSADLMNAANGHQHRTTPYLAGLFSIRRWWRRKGLRWPQFAPDSPLEEAGFETSVPPDRCSGGTYPADVRSDAPTFLSSGAC